MSNKSILVIGDSKYDLALASKLGKGGPSVTIAIDEIHDIDDENHCPVIQAKEFIDEGTIVFYKQHGKFSVILGRETYRANKEKYIKQGKVPGSIISSVALKKAKIEI